MQIIPSVPLLASPARPSKTTAESGQGFDVLIRSLDATADANPPVLPELAKGDGGPDPDILPAPGAAETESATRGERPEFGEVAVVEPPPAPPLVVNQNARKQTISASADSPESTSPHTPVDPPFAAQKRVGGLVQSGYLVAAASWPVSLETRSAQTASLPFAPSAPPAQVADAPLPDNPLPVAPNAATSRPAAPPALPFQSPSAELASKDLGQATPMPQQKGSDHVGTHSDQRSTPPLPSERPNSMPAQAAAVTPEQNAMEFEPALTNNSARKADDSTQIAKAEPGSKLAAPLRQDATSRPDKLADATDQPETALAKEPFIAPGATKFATSSTGAAPSVTGPEFAPDTATPPLQPVLDSRQMREAKPRQTVKSDDEPTLSVPLRPTLSDPLGPQLRVQGAEYRSVGASQQILQTALAAELPVPSDVPAIYRDGAASSLLSLTPAPLSRPHEGNFSPAQQVAQAMIRLGSNGIAGPVELALNPAELGQVRFEMTTTGDKLHITLFIERPDTMDLIRRHGDQLLSDLRISGFNNPSLSFGDWSQRESRTAPGSGQIKDAEPEAMPAQGLPSSAMTHHVAAAGRLDMRL